VLFLGTLINALGGSMVMAFFAIYLLRLGASATIIGLAVTISTGIGALSQLVAGSLCDSIGRKRILVFSLASGSIMLAIMGMTTSLFLLILLNLLCGVSFALLTPAVDAIVADIVQEPKRVEAYGLLRMAFNAGYGVGVIVGGLLAAISYPLLFFLDAVGAAIYCLSALFFLRESVPVSSETAGFLQTTKEYKIIAKDRPFLLFSLYGFLLWFMYSQSMTPFSVYSFTYKGINEPQLGILWSINTWMVVCLQLLITKLVEKLRLTHALAIGSLLCSASFLVVPLASNFYSLIPFMILLTFSELIISPTLSAGVAKVAREEKRGRYMGFFGLCRSIGWSLGPSVGGAITDLLPNKHILWCGVSLLGLLPTVGYFTLSLVPKDSEG
jgi:MFS family permease